MSFASSAHAEATPAPVAELPEPLAELSVPAEQAAPDAGTITIPKLTPVSIEISALLGTKISTSGDSFPIRLVEPIMIDGAEVVPAGTEGIGEVVHAKKGSGMGSAGELVLAARYLEVDGRQLPLRSMKFVALGKDNIATTAAVGLTLGLPALFISGGNTEVPVGTRASAMVREDFIIGQVEAGEDEQPSVLENPEPQDTIVEVEEGDVE